MDSIFNKKINLLDELSTLRLSNGISSDDLLVQAKSIIKEEVDKDKSIVKRLSQEVKDKYYHYDINVDALEKDKIYTVYEIQKLCERYRLRFLDTSQFKADFPQEAITKIKQTESELGVHFENYKIIAPASVFNLKDSFEDPILLANMGNNRYYFIHKWGNDINASRAIKYYPIRNLSTLLTFVLAITSVLTLIVPTSWIMKGDFMASYEIFYRVMFFVSCFVWISAIFLYYGLVWNKNLSENDWDNKYFN